MPPRWLITAMLRGLSPDPAARWPSVDALVTVLAESRQRNRRWALAATSLAVVIGGGAWLASAPEDARCSGAQRRLESIWDPARRTEVGTALLGTSVPYAAETWARVEAGLNEYAERWAASHTAACEAGRDAAPILDARMRCLGVRRRALAAVVDTLAHADTDMVRHATRAVSGLPDVGRCDDLQRIETSIALPDDPVVAARVEALRERLARVRALREAGKYDAGLAVVEIVHAEATSLHHPPLAIEAAYELGRAQELTGAYADAVETLREVHFDALRVGMDEIAAETAAKITFLLASRLGRADEALAWAPHAQAEVSRIGIASAEASLLSSVGAAHHAKGDYDEAARSFESALAIREATLGPHDRSVAEPLNNLAAVRFSTGAFDEARTLLERALGIVERSLGPGHPEVALVSTNLATACVRTQSYDDALAHTARALEIQQATLGPEHPDVAELLGTMAYIHNAMGHHEEALALDTASLRALERAHGQVHPSVAMALNNLANRHIAVAAYDDARPLLERAVDIMEEVRGPEHPELAQILSNLALVHQVTGSLEQARSEYERALEILQASLLPEHPHQAFALTGLAEIALQEGRLAEAEPLAERALELRTTGNFPPFEIADSHFLLAKVLHTANVGSPRALVLAEQALAIHRDAGSDRATRAEIESWLDGARQPDGSYSSVSETSSK